MTNPAVHATQQRVVLDTNVLVSALLTPDGNPSKILRAVIDGQFALVYSANILTEYASVLARPRFGFDSRDIGDLLGFITAFGEAIAPEPSDVAMADESDRPFYDVHTAAAATLVTGNVKHFPLLDQVMTPADFVKTYLS